MKKQKKTYLFAILAILCWSTVATAFKIALAGMDFLHLLLFSSGAAILFFSVVLLLKSQWMESFRVERKYYLHSAVLGFLNPFAYYLVLLKAYEILPAQFAMSLNYIWPISLVLLSIPLLKQKIAWKSIACILLSFLGVVVIANKGSFRSMQIPDTFGVILALGSSIFWALYWIYNVRDQRSEEKKLLLNFIFGFLYVFLSISIFSEFKLPGIPALLAAMYIGIVECGIAYVFWLKALKLSDTTDRIGNLVFISPFISLFFIHRILGESIYLSTLAGLLLIIAGIFLQSFIHKSKSIE